MHVLFIHQNFPAQFGHLAKRLAEDLNWRCSFVSEQPSAIVDDIEKIQYTIEGGATPRTHFCSRTFENAIWHCDGVYHALVERSDIQPDLIVAHSGFGSSLFLRELYPTTPVVNLFEYYYHPHGVDTDMEFRHDLNWPVQVAKFQRASCRNAMILLDLQNCQAGYCPTEFQRSRFPAEYREKLSVVFDGVDRAVYHGFAGALRPPAAQRQSRVIAGVTVGPTTRVVSYVSRGFESMRGFDIFVRATQLIQRQYPDVVFIVVGSEKMVYGGDESHIAPHANFKDWTLAQQPYDLGKVHFVGRLAMGELARLMASTDVHMYLTVPFVLSWSMMDAMSCGAIVVGSGTSPVKEMIQHEQNGLLADFFDPAAFADQTVRVLRDPDAYRHLGDAAEKMIADRYSIEAVLPGMLNVYETAMGRALPRRRLPERPPLPPRKAPPKTITPVEDTESLVTSVKPRARSPFLG